MAKAIKNLLADYGYNIVALPKAGIRPLQLLYRNGDSLGSLDSSLYKFFTTGDKAPPELQMDNETASIEGATAVKFDAKAGVSVLDWLLDKLNMGKLAGKLALDAGHTVTISYQQVREDKVDLLDLDNYISESQPSKTQFNSYRKMLENSELYVINAVLKSTAITLAVTDSNGQHLDMEATVKGIVDASVDVTRNKNNSISLTHAGAEPVVFGFKAQQIIYEPSSWWQFWKKEEARFRIRDQQGEVLKGEDELPTKPLILGDAVADI